jgi:hypothetical protein
MCRPEINQKNSEFAILKSNSIHPEIKRAVLTCPFAEILQQFSRDFRAPFPDDLNVEMP